MFLRKDKGQLHICTILIVLLLVVVMTVLFSLQNMPVYASNANNEAAEQIYEEEELRGEAALIVVVMILYYYDEQDNMNNGNKVGEYVYDAWGNILNLAQVNANATLKANPWRYRGYYYDNESGFYYLNSRYYDPEFGRFINADEPSMLYDTADTVGGVNLYSYCYNNPIKYIDPMGEFVITASVLTWLVIGVVALIGVTALSIVETETHAISNGLDMVWNAVVNGYNSLAKWMNGWGNNPPAAHTGTQSREIPGAMDGYTFAKSKPVPLREGVKGQGREAGERKKNSSNWKPSNKYRTPKTPKKHTPGRDHNKFRLWWFLAPEFLRQLDGGYYY